MSPGTFSGGIYVIILLFLAETYYAHSTKYKRSRLHEELSLLLVEHQSIEKYDLEDWLDDAFDEHFNLRLEDGSVGEMSQILFECLSLIRRKTPGDVPAVLSRLPTPTQTANQTQQTTLKLESEDESGSDDEEMMT